MKNNKNFKENIYTVDVIASIKKAFLDTLNIEVNKVDNSEIEGFGGYNFEAVSPGVNGKNKWVVFLNAEDVEKFARIRLQYLLKNEPYVFNVDWLKGFISISDSQKDFIASKEAEIFVTQISDEEILAKMGKAEEYQKLCQETIDFNAEIETLVNGSYASEDEIIKANEEIMTKELELDKKKQAEFEFLIQVKADFINIIKTKVIESLVDPIQYFVYDTKLYGLDILFNQNFITIDINAAIEDALKSESLGYHIDQIDGEEQEVKNNDDGSVYKIYGVK